MELALSTDARNGTVLPNILQRQPTELRDADGTAAHLNPPADFNSGVFWAVEHGGRKS